MADITPSSASMLVFELSTGPVVFQLRSDLAPTHVARISELADSGFYDGLTFHRVIDDFVAQGGDPAGNGTGGSGQTINAELSGEVYERGIVGMARSTDINSADSQFFITFARQTGLDNLYTVWAETVFGMANVEQLPSVASDSLLPISNPGTITTVRTQTLQFADGTSEPDTITGTDAAEVLFGDDGNDTIVGGGGDDTIDGWDGDDSILGGAGDDVIEATRGDDTIVGGDGTDTLVLSGNRSDFGIGFDLQGGLVIQGFDGNAGKLSVTGVETLSFFDQSITVADFSLPFLELAVTTTDEGTLSGGTVRTTFTYTEASAPVAPRLTFVTTDGTAVSGQDFQGGTLNAVLSGSGASIDVLLTADYTAEEDETFTITISDVYNAVLRANGNATLGVNINVAISDDDSFRFDAQEYLDTNADLAAGGITTETALDHFLAFGYSEGRMMEFNENDYLTANPDIVAAGITGATALEHYLNFGRSEGRLLDAEGYLIANPDLVAAGIAVTDAGSHYQTFGRTEGRRTDFDPNAYMARNTDLREAGITEATAINHFLTFGQNEGRQFLDGAAYLAANPDVARAGADAYTHYEFFGASEGRSLAPVGADSIGIGVEGL
ncbi:MAG: peptidylprolyl isomerase [Alphaproteobacteria bacterium]|nr:peptidylprolyl isomerase [Alphaproteobacteria bacterium]